MHYLRPGNRDGQIVLLFLPKDQWEIPGNPVFNKGHFQTRESGQKQEQVDPVLADSEWHLEL